MNESAASTTLKRIALFKVNKVPYLLEFNINWAAATHLTRVWSRWDELGKQAVSVARSGWWFPALSSAKPAHFNKNQPKILTAKIMLYDFITMSIKVDKDHFYLLKIK